MSTGTTPTEAKNILDSLGNHVFDDAIAYCAGDRLICWPPDITQDRFDTTGVPPKRLAIDENLSEREAFEGTKKVVGLSPNPGRVLLAHAISAITRSAYRAARITPCATIEIIGNHATFKSTYSSFVTQLYDRDDEIAPITGMGASPRFIEEILFEFCECTVVIDDLHPADAKGMQRRNEETAEEIKRRVGNNTGRGRMEGNTMVQRNPRGNAIFTGEYIVGSGSTAARSLVVEFTTPINKNNLTKCQAQPLLVSTFYFNFIKFFVEHYHDIAKSLAERLVKHRGYNPSISPRLWETQFCLQSAYMMFLQYALDKGFISTQTAQDEYYDFWRLLTSLVQAQNARIEPEVAEKSQVADYFKLFRELYKGDRFRLGKDKDQFEPEKHDGFLDDELIYLRSERLLTKIQKVVRVATLNDIRDALVSKSALKVDSEGKNVKVPIRQVCGDGNAKITQMRFICIYLKKLK